MKKLALALAVATLSLSTAAFAADPAEPEFGTTGNIKFEGRIIESGCTLETGTSAVINLGTMSVAAIQKGPSGWTHGQIRFVDCNLDVADDGKKLEGVELTILPGQPAGIEPDSQLGITETNLWANDGSAQNVGVEVAIAALDGSVTDASGDSMIVTPKGTKDPIRADIMPASDMAIYDVKGRMVGAATGVTVGSVEATLTFNAEYK